MNLIFDIGNVILNFKPRSYLEARYENAKTADALMAAIFEAPEWLMLDRGEISQGEAFERFVRRAPENEREIRELERDWVELLTPIDESVAMLCDLREKKYGLYYLSNFHMHAKQIVLKANAFFSLFDGGVFSCDVNLSKPEQAIYHCVLEKYALEADSCLFFDDMAENVEGAERAGVRAYVFEDTETVYRAVINNT